MANSNGHNKPIAITTVLVVILTILFPPFSKDLGQHGTGDFNKFAFVLDAPYRNEIDWGILALEWLLVALIVGLVLYLRKPSSDA